MYSVLLAGITILLASAGANGITNYLDRHVDARMERTRKRALAAKRIEPAEKVLPLVIGLIIVGLVLAWYLHPLSFLADLIGTSAAAFWRKRVTCVFPQGMLALYRVPSGGPGGRRLTLRQRSVRPREQSITVMLLRPLAP